jgi:hypothetical protein
MSKMTRAKWNGDMAQAVEHLLCKHEALSSNSSPMKNKKVKKMGHGSLGIFHGLSFLMRGQGG